MAVNCGEITLLNLHAPFVTAKRGKMETVFNTDLAYLLRNAPENFFLNCDFNCVLEAADSIRHCTYSTVLAEFVHCYALKDVWKQPHQGVFILIISRLGRLTTIVSMP